MNLPEGDVRQWDVLEWALDQAQYLTPHEHHLLLYLCLTAFYREDNPEGQKTGVILSRRSSLISMAFYTGMSRRTLQRTLAALQEATYVIYMPSTSNSLTNGLRVFWTEEDDLVREQIRAGARALPAPFVRKPRVRVTRHLASVTDIHTASATVTPPLGSQ